MATPADYTSAGFQEAVAAIVEQKTYNWIFDINASFLLTSGYLVFMMQLGFALVSECYRWIAEFYQPFSTVRSVYPWIWPYIDLGICPVSSSVVRTFCSTAEPRVDSMCFDAAHYWSCASQERQVRVFEKSDGCLCWGCGIFPFRLRICIRRPSEL